MVTVLKKKQGYNNISFWLLYTEAIFPFWLLYLYMYSAPIECSAYQALIYKVYMWVVQVKFKLYVT